MRRGLGRRRGRSLGIVAAVVAATVGSGLVVATPALATNVVNCASSALQPKINGATPGSTLLLKGTCVGNFVVDRNLTLKASPAATLDGDQQGTTLTVIGSPSVHLAGLVVTGGFATNGGGIDQTSGGKLTLDHVTVTGNQAGGGPTVFGGGITTTGTLTVVSSSIVGNLAFAGDSVDTVAAAAGIYAKGPTTVTSSTVSSNVATATSSGGQASAVAGGLLVQGAPLQLTSSHVDHNRVTASTDSDIANVEAGGIDDLSAGFAVSITGSTVNGNVLSARSSNAGALATGAGARLATLTATLSNSQFAGNQGHAVAHTQSASQGGGIAVAGTTSITRLRVVGNRVTASGGLSAFGGAAGLASSGRTSIASSVVSGNSASMDGGTNGAFAEGGGFLGASGPVRITRSTFDRDRIILHSQGPIALAGGGAISISSGLTMNGSTVSGSVAHATATGSNTAEGEGGGIDLTSSTAHAAITNSTISGNSVVADSDATTGTSDGHGGGISTKTSSVKLTDATVAGNGATGSGHTQLLRGGGLFVSAGTTTLIDSILGLNSAPLSSGGQNCFGPVASGGHNVLGTTLGCTFTSSTGDLVGVDPKLGSLAANGGATLTRALLAASPAINHVPTGSCLLKVDQRGIHRPQGPACDSGAFERKP
ncbi:MAG: choice-of-anchor Q domain-containing protein [Actinomycetota bacterium]